MARLTDILQWCDQTLKTSEFRDYAPNGLQIEGSQEVNKILCAVTASQEAIDAAIAQKQICYWFIMVISGKANPIRLPVCAANVLKL